MNIREKKILIIEDTPEYTLIVQTALGLSDSFYYASNLKEAFNFLSESIDFDLIILDMNLPDGMGHEVLLKLKEETGNIEIPVIITSGRGEVSDKVMGLNLGAIDYVVKPFDPIELRARIESKFQFFLKFEKNSMLQTVGNLTIDINTFQINISESAINLTALEFKLVKFFCESNEQLFSRDQILSKVWGDNVNVLDRTVDSTIASLRRKTKDWDHKINTIYGMGYKLMKNAA